MRFDRWTGIAVVGIGIALSGCGGTGSSGTVNKTNPTITWADPAPIIYGATLASALNATSTVTGSYAYTATPAGGSAVTVTSTTVLTAGSYTLDATLTPSDSNDYNTASASVPLTVDKATPALTLPAEGTVTYPAPLSATQLDATALGVDGKTLAGSFTYTATPTAGGTTQTATAGTILTVGAWTLTADFAPTDSNNYVTTASVSAVLNVVCGAPVLDSISPATWWSHGNFAGIVPIEVNGACFQSGDQFSMNFGAGVNNWGSVAGFTADQITVDLGLGTNLAMPMAVKTTDSRAGGTPTSNALYWLSLGDQNLGAFFSDGTWVHVESNPTGGSSLYQSDATGKLEKSCPLEGGGNDIAVDVSNGYIGIGGGVTTMTLDGNGYCTSNEFMGSNGANVGVSSSVMLNGRYCVTAGLISCIPDNQPWSEPTPTSTNATALAAVCGSPWSSVATTIAGRDTMIVFCREKTATTTTPSLVSIDMATMTIGTVTQLTNFTTYSAMSAASTTANGWSTAGGWPMALSSNLGVVAICSTYDSVCDFYSTSTLQAVGIKTITVPANTYRIADDELNAQFVATVGHAQAPVTTLLAIDPMTGDTKTPAATVNGQILGTVLVSNGTVLGSDLTGQTYVLAQ
jgi:hypothetical protein